MQNDNNHRIFVVDDEEVIVETLAIILRNSGFDATPFTEPLKALEASRSHSPDLLISDVVMPEINGIELAIQLLQICPECTSVPPVRCKPAPLASVNRMME